MSLVEIKPEVLGVTLDLVYASAANVTGRPLYRRQAGYLHIEAATALGRAAQMALRLGYRLRLLDLFRPVEVQWLLWEFCPDPAFVADPRNGGSAHARGVAVDLTLEHALSGEPLDMGTAFDDFSARAGHGATGLAPEAERNRALLAGIMAASGFCALASEWWHYQLPDAGRYPPLSDSAAATNLVPERAV
ncbi:D-alanyl-D-alanine dipeptidase [Radicibacter daui]|uniref:D-alanyl-D-alanine dipeptidase n=1 Tax=Radicibacter daui TaxID=3064829 RepID=UPI004046EE1C